ncbi:MAG: SGNH/GDSL hydrolase family protein [Polyangiales bacterium]
MKRRLGVLFLLVAVVAAACASKPTCSATAQSSDNADCTQPASDDNARPRASFMAIPIEDPTGQAMSAFHQALRTAQQRRGKARILIYGASHVAADIYPDLLRSRLQARFGEAGPGFAFPAKPLTWYRHSGVSLESSQGWAGNHVKVSEPPSDRFFGLAGMYLTSNASRRPARSAFTTKAHAGLKGFASDFELFYWKQPGGGRFKLSIDGVTRELSAAAGTAGPAYEPWHVADGQHRVEVITRGDGPVRVFGMSMERDTPGVVVDALGIPGARAKTQLSWDEDLHREHLTRRHPDLVVIAYGTNESGDDGQPIEEYAADLRRVVSRIKRVLPQASCLLIGPSDRPTKLDGGKYEDRPRTAQIVATQREVSREVGCGFFDLVSFMGGPLSMLDWVDGEPPLGASDHVHFTHRGYEALGNVLYDALLMGYEAPAPVAFGPRPIAPPGSTVSEIKRDNRERSRRSSHRERRSRVSGATSGPRSP